jgi:hypothetical protein
MELSAGVVDGVTYRILEEGRVSCFGPPIQSLSCRQLTVLGFRPAVASGQRSLPAVTLFWIPSVFFNLNKIHA